MGGCPNSASAVVAWWVSRGFPSYLRGHTGLLQSWWGSQLLPWVDAGKSPDFALGVHFGFPPKTKFRGLLMKGTDKKKQRMFSMLYCTIDPGLEK